MSAAADLLTIPEASAVLRVSVSTLRGWIAAGTGPRTVRIGRLVRIDRADLERFINERKNGRQTPGRDGP